KPSDEDDSGAAVAWPFARLISVLRRQTVVEDTNTRLKVWNSFNESVSAKIGARHNESGWQEFVAQQVERDRVIEVDERRHAIGNGEELGRNQRSERRIGRPVNVQVTDSTPSHELGQRESERQVVAVVQVLETKEAIRIVRDGALVKRSGVLLKEAYERGHSSGPSTPRGKIRRQISIC